MQQGGANARLLRLRRARARRRAARRPARSPSGASGWRRCSTAQDRSSASRRPSRTGRRSSAAAKEQRLEGVIAKQARSTLRAGQAQPQLAQGEDDRAPGVPHRRLHEGPGAPSVEPRRARPRRARRARSCAGPETAAPGFDEDELERLLRQAAPARAQDAARSTRCRRCRGCEAATSSGSTPKLVCEVEFAEWTHDRHLRAPRYVGLRDDKAPEAVRREHPVDDRAAPRQARPQALQPRQGLLAGRGDHEGRPASPTTRRSRPCSSRT